MAVRETDKRPLSDDVRGIGRRFLGCGSEQGALLETGRGSAMMEVQNDLRQ